MRLLKPTTKQIDLGDGEYIEVVADISKRTFNDLVSKMPQDIDGDKGMTPTQGTQFQEAVFATFVKGWSVTDEEGNALPADPDVYLDLPNEFASRIDEALLAHFGEITTVGPEDSKKRTTSRAR